MDKKLRQNILKEIDNLKKETGLRIVDSHIHPWDVMGVAHYGDLIEKINRGGEYKTNFYDTNFGEKMRFGRFYNFLSGAVFNFYPKVAIKEIEGIYNYLPKQRFLEEMNSALIDEIVMLPIEPWTITEDICELYKDKRFNCLGSLNIHGINLEDIPQKIKLFKEKYNIIGIKLHPNLQNFKPRPRDNSSDIAEKLEVIYKEAEKYKLYLLFHGGYSSYTKEIHGKYQPMARSKTNSLLHNFCDDNGDSEIFRYNIPIVIAHLGHFGTNQLQVELLKKIVGKNDNIYFDTAAVSPAMITEAINTCGHERILLGSDAIYNHMFYALCFTYEAVKNSNVIGKNKALINIFASNFYKIANK